MPGLLTETERCRFDQEGIVFPIPVLSCAEVTRYRSCCDELEMHLGGRPRTIETRQMHLHFSWAYQLATHPRLLDAVQDVLGPNLLVWATEVFAKPPQNQTVSIGWHRDRRYMGLEHGRTASAWIALSDSNAANGCMRALPKCREPQGAAAEADMVANAAASNLVDVELPAGSISLHDPDLVHGSGPNNSGVKRVGFVVRYITPECVPSAGRPPVVLARGTDPWRHCEHIPPPAAVDLPQALAGMRASAARHLDEVLRSLQTNKVP